MNTFCSIKIFLEAASVFIGDPKQSELSTAASWFVVTEFTFYSYQQKQRQLQQLDLLDNVNSDTQMFISDELLTNVLSHLNSIQEGGDSLKYLQPTILRFIGRVGHFIISRFALFAITIYSFNLFFFLVW